MEYIFNNWLQLSNLWRSEESGVLFAFEIRQGQAQNLCLCLWSLAPKDNTVNTTPKSGTRNLTSQNPVRRGWIRLSRHKGVVPHVVQHDPRQYGPRRGRGECGNDDVFAKFKIHSQLQLNGPGPEPRKGDQGQAEDQFHVTLVSKWKNIWGPAATAQAYAAPTNQTKEEREREITF